LLAAGTHWAGDPESARAVIIVDANTTPQDHAYRTGTFID
jgi:hypothetical protein